MKRAKAKAKWSNHEIKNAFQVARSVLKEIGDQNTLHQIGDVFARVAEALRSNRAAERIRKIPAFRAHPGSLDS